MIRNNLQLMLVQILVLLLFSSTFSYMTGTASAQAEPRIALVAAPDSVAPSQKISISWEVQGTGKVSHTAVHWDTKQGNPADYKSYGKATSDFAAMDPPQDAPKKYTVTFDAPASGTVYYVVHAIVDGKNIYHADGERKISVGDAMMKKGDAMVKEDAMKKGDAMMQQTGTYGGLDMTMLIGIGAIVVVGVIVVVAITRRGKV